jgi:phospholipid/cholesterol/gamma-HCH transport system permease protein
MRVSEQIDALEIMGINTKSYLIMPKIISAIIMIPCLIIVAITLSLLGGFATGMLTHTVAKDQYIYGLVTDFRTFNITVALTKAFVFAFIIASVPSYYGYNVEGGALEIGRSSTTSVIVTCIMILLADYVLTMLML